MQIKFHKYLFRKSTVLPWLAVLTFLLTEIFSRNRAFTESFYAQKIYPFIANILSGFSTLFPFSIDDIFYLLLIGSAVILFIFILFRKIKFKKAGAIILNVLSAIYVLFYFLWGFNYYRENLNSRLGLAEQEVLTSDFISVLENLIENTNNTYCNFNDFSKNEIDSMVEKSYSDLNEVLKINYPAGKRKDKKITMSRFFAKAGISGYYGPFFNEVHVNTYNLPLSYPFVLAHEKAHQFGITSEAEANFYAWLVCSQSQSNQLKYSANFHILLYFLNQAYKLEEYPKMIEKLDDRVKNDYRKNEKHWAELKNEKVDKVASKANDTYLKSNKVEKGIDDYYGVVKFVMNFSLDSAFQKQAQLYGK